MIIAEKFEKLALYQKVEIALLLLFFYGAILYYYEKNLSHRVLHLSTSNIEHKVDKKNNITKITSNEAIVFIEKTLDNFQVHNAELKLLNNNISVQIQGSFEQIANFLNSIEKHMKIVSFEIQPMKSMLQAKIVLEKLYLFDELNGMSETLKLSLEKSPFAQKSTPVHKVLTKPNFTPPDIRFDAIVFNEVIWKGNWYRVGDMIGDNKIVSIKNNVVVLFNSISKEEFTIKGSQ